MSTKDVIINKLREAFLPESLDVTDESHLHEGHAGHRPGGETHFRVYIVSPAFEGKSRIERHRMVNATLDAELKGSVRACDQGAGARGNRGPVISQTRRTYERPMTMSQRLIVLAGLPGSGKSTLAEGLSRHLRCRSSRSIRSRRRCGAAVCRGIKPGSRPT